MVYPRMRTASGGLHLLMRGKIRTGSGRHGEEVSAAHDALQQEIMELSQEQQDVLTEKHVEVKRVRVLTRSNKRPDCKSCDDSPRNSQPRIRPESRQLHSQVH